MRPVIAMLWLGCRPGGPVEGAGGDAEPLPVRLPEPAGASAPSRLSVEGDGIAAVDACGECHAEQQRAWSRSAHAHASFDNPWYRTSVEHLRAEVGRAESRHCAGCHDPVLLVAGRMEQEVDPADPDAALGVTCLVCHGAVGATSDGNASVRVDLRDLSYPGPQDEGVEAHRERMLSPALREGRVCGACHRGFLGPDTGNAGHVLGMDDQGSWRSGSYGGTDSLVLSLAPPQRAGCIDCHLPRGDHRFPGAQTPIAASTGALPASEALLRGAAEIRVGALWVEGRPVPPGSASGPVEAVDVVVWNTGTGHAFPGGTHDLQDTWIEVEVTDPAGAPIGVSGRSVDDPEAARLRAVVIDAEGRRVETHQTDRIVTAALDRTVPQDGAAAVRFALPEPALIGAVSVRLRHRRHPAAMAAAACEATARGTLDGCAEQPVVEISEDRVEIGDPPELRRAFAHALALGGELGERLDDGRPSAALVASLASTDRERAAAAWLVARVAARQGRRAEALEAASRAEALVGPHAAIARVRGDAAAAVWDWPAAAAAYGALVSLAPYDTAGWRDLARARGSAGDPEGALAAATSGLALQPRDEGLLRSQALALRALGDPRSEAAEAAWLDHRAPDDAADLRLACERSVPLCERDRVPVPLVPLSEP